MQVLHDFGENLAKSLRKGTSCSDLFYKHFMVISCINVQQNLLYKNLTFSLKVDNCMYLSDLLAH